MNELIDEFAFNAGCNRHKYWDPKHPELEGFIISQAVLDKFAELIVSECARVCNNIDAEYEGEDVLATWCATAIREHFGVEE